MGLGLNPKGFRYISLYFLLLPLQWIPCSPSLSRAYYTKEQYLYTPQKNVLDAQLIWQYTQLSVKEKIDFAKQIGNHPSSSNEF